MIEVKIYGGMYDGKEIIGNDLRRIVAVVSDLLNRTSRLLERMVSWRRKTIEKNSHKRCANKPYRKYGNFFYLGRAHYWYPCGSPKGKQFAGLVLFDDVVYNKNSAYSSNEYLIDETIFMYAFVQKGYRLYNGKEVIKYNEGKVDFYPKRLTDNESEMRNFLRNNMDVMYEKLLDYCKYKGVLEKEKIDKKIECANKNIDNAIDRINEIDITDKVYITSNRSNKDKRTPTFG